MSQPIKQNCTAYIGLGSNLDSPVDQVLSARKEIVNLGVVETAFSDLYASAPMGPQDQPDYVNAVMMVNTSLSPLDLLHRLQNIERNHGRVRKQHWGARTLDLDLLVYGDIIMASTELTLPHPGVTERAFVLYPLFDCNPELIIPGKGHIAELLSRCPFSGIRRLDPHVFSP